MPDLFTLMFLLFAAAALYVLLIAAPRVQRNWMALPSAEDYAAHHPDAVGHGMPHCCRCGSDSLISEGLQGPSDFRRRMRCANCQTLLYRNEN